MSPRRARRRPDPAPAAPDVTRVEPGPDGADWQVRPVRGDTPKTYRCPGCDQEIRPGTAHVVAWPAWPGGQEDRRHWHTACWANRLRRAPRLQRSRDAPRHG